MVKKIGFSIIFLLGLSTFFLKGKRDQVDYSNYYSTCQVAALTESAKEYMKQFKNGTGFSDDMESINATQLERCNKEISLSKGRLYNIFDEEIELRKFEDKVIVCSSILTDGLLPFSSPKTIGVVGYVIDDQGRVSDYHMCKSRGQK